MRVLVIGKGGREHAIVRALTFSSKVERVHALPGSDGMSAQALCHDVDSFNFNAIFSIIPFK